MPQVSRARPPPFPEHALMGGKHASSPESLTDSFPPAKKSRAEGSTMTQLHLHLSLASPAFDAEAAASPLPLCSPTATRTVRTSTSPLDAIPDDVLSIVLSHAAAGSHSPGDFINLLITSRRFCSVGGRASVLRHLPPPALQVAAATWCPAAQRFLARCVQAGNPFASFALGMIAFYCLNRPAWGMKMLAQGALAGNADALYSLAVIHFNGSGGGKETRDVASGVLLCMQASALGHADATRELGHCLQDGYGVVRDPSHGRRLLLHANMQETAEALRILKLADVAGASCSGEDHPCCEEHEQCCSSGEEGPQPTAFSQWRKRHRHASPADVRPLSRSLSAPALLRSQRESHFQLFSKTREASSPRDEVAIDRSSLRDSLTQSQGNSCDCAGNSEEASPSAPNHGQQVNFSLHSRPNVPIPDNSAQVGGDVPRQHQPRESHERGGHQCCCLPTVTLPLHVRTDGWVRLFLMDWTYLMEMGLIQSASLIQCERDLNAVGEAGGEGEQLPCSNQLCGRRELRASEFRCCSVCTEARYCSRVCQAQDWKMGHKHVCARLAETQLMQEDNDL